MDGKITKKQILSEISKDNYNPMTFKELMMLFKLPENEESEFADLLSKLVDEKLIKLSKNGRYIPQKKRVVTGRFISNERGFGFVEVDGEDEDYFIPSSFVNGAFHHDLVEISVDEIQNGKRKEGRVEKILSHEIFEVVGTLQKSKTFGYVIPDNKKIGVDIFIPGKDLNKACQNDKVVAHIKNYGGGGKKPEGEITEIIGNLKTPGVDISSIVRAYDIPSVFSDEVKNEAKSIPSKLTKNDMADRRDIRNWKTVTIDGEDTKDIDDAVTLEKKNGIYKLGVHIADVSNYVKEGTNLDKEALKRGTSVYLADRVIPMLPTELSNGICSLNEGKDRLALSCIMSINEKGEVVDHEIAQTVICVDRRITYTSVKKIIEDNDQSETDKYSDFVSMFLLMDELSKLLRKKRHDRGAVDFDFPECRIKLDSKNRPIEIEAYERSRATEIIEDFMLTANETIAESIYWRQMPFVYRSHENPDRDMIDNLSLLVSAFGYSMKKSENHDIHPKEIQKLLKQAKGSPNEDMIKRITLRSMKRAEYTPDCKGHFGLAAKYYCHFTSPIRRYPDLLVHRIIKECINEEMSDERKEHFQNILPDISKDCSEKERRADDAERESEKIKKAEYIKSRIGEEYVGMISGVTGFGIYVELPNTIEGLVHVSNMMDDHYIYDEESYSMTGERKKKSYSIGQTVRVRVENADTQTGNIDFSLVG